MFVNFNILNQLGSPAINSNTFANRPAAGQTGRLFVSTDTFEIYRDNGTTWDLIGGPGSSTITGTGTATQVAYFTSSQAIGSSVNLYWDNTNNRLGINTATPTAHLDVHSAADVAMQLNGTGATPTVLQQFLSAGVAQYELGYNWNASADYRRFSIYDNVGAKEVISIDQQSRYVGINYQYSSLSDQPAYTFDVSGSGRFTDNGYFDSSGTGFVGINTVTPLGKMNIVSDGSAQANLYLTRYNSNGSHLLFYSAAGTKTVPTAIQNNDELGKISFNGYNGTTFNNTTAIIKAEAVENFTNLAQGTRLSFFTTSQGTTSPIQTMILNDAGDLAIAQGNAPTQALNAYRGGSTQTVFSAGNSNTGLNGTYFGVDATGNGIMNTTGAFASIFSTNSTERARFTSGGNFLIGTTVDSGEKFQVTGTAKITGATNITNSLTSNSLLVGGSTTFTRAYIADTLTATSIGTNYNPGILNIQNLSNTNGNLSLIGFQDASAFVNLAAMGAINVTHSSSPNSVVGDLAFYTKPSGSGYVVERTRIKSTGQLRFVPLAADPGGAQTGDVYYNSGTNKLRLYDGTNWVDLN